MREGCINAELACLRPAQGMVEGAYAWGGPAARAGAVRLSHICLSAALLQLVGQHPTGLGLSWAPRCTL